ncbi:MAG: four-carbon acid sugar kinase family protein [Actinomycetota bacterium]|nr:four-carbon acid sugar kinase family protein [Actinomycetota bacterium]
MREWLVAADDRTGAFEVAGLLAAVQGPVPVTVGWAPAGNAVVDLGSRRLTAGGAAARAAAVAGIQAAAWRAHKIDSTLRGNWVHELRARSAAGERIVLLPAWPEMGRTCRDGVVHVHGAPLASVIEQLPEALLLRGPDALREWLAGADPVGVCDVPDTETMVALAQVLAGADVVVVGPAGPIGAAFTARFAADAAVAARASYGGQVVPTLLGPVMVLCGSAHAMAAEQIVQLRAARLGVTVVTAPAPSGALHHCAAGVLACEARAIARGLQPNTIVIIGGDTAAEFLGDGPRLVGGFIAPGMPWSRDQRGRGPLVVTRAGGFGRPDSLVQLLTAR